MKLASLAGLAVRLPARPRMSRPAAAVLALTLAACSRPPAETRFLNFDAESAGPALTSGWSGFEKTAAGDTFVWAQAREARVSLLAAGAGERLVRFRAWPYRWDGAPPQQVTVSLNGARLGSQTMGDGPQVYSLPSPGPAWKAGPNVLAFDFAYAEAPRDRVPGASDTRTLAAAFDWIEVLPASGAAGRP